MSNVGAISHLGCFSFQSSKNVTAGEGGIILANDDDLADRCWSIHNCGREPGGRWYEHHTIGGNYRLGEFQGAVLNAQWDRFAGQAETRESNGRYLAARLADVPGVTCQARTPDCTRHGYHLFFFRVDPVVLGVGREVFLEALGAEGIPAVAGYPIPLYRQPLFVNGVIGPYVGSRAAARDSGPALVKCPCCEALSTEQSVWIAHRVLLGDRQDMDDVAAAIRKVVDHREEMARNQ